MNVTLAYAAWSQANVICLWMAGEEFQVVLWDPVTVEVLGVESVLRVQTLLGYAHGARVVLGVRDGIVVVVSPGVFTQAVQDFLRVQARVYRVGYQLLGLTVVFNVMTDELEELMGRLNVPTVRRQ